MKLLRGIMFLLIAVIITAVGMILAPLIGLLLTLLAGAATFGVCCFIVYALLLEYDKNGDN